GALGGEAHAVAQGVMNVPGAAKSAFSVAQNGRLVYLHGSEQKGNSLTWHTVGSDTVVPVADLALYDLVALSPDERTAAVLVTDAVGTYEVWTVDLARNLRTRFTTTQVDEYDVVWGRDSRTLYFISDDSDSTSIYTKVVGSPAAPKLVVRGEPGMRLWDVTPDGRSIIASRGNQAQEFVRIDLADGGIHPFGTTSPVLGMARMSPDGRWLAYSSGISGTLQVYVAPYPAMDWVVQVSTELGAWNAWIDGGRGLVYQGQDGLFTVTMTEQDGRMLVGPPVAVMPAEAPQPESRHWDVTADGRRYLVLDAVSPDRKNYCDLILDWPALVGR
ncbi:MAG TPA: hypothetical protein PLQ13_00900, partial [Candidatus Krumholzibacteria bacterium]|nr:hypothetical protein [Candidatus Krumholzibacteria bacterium]